MSNIYLATSVFVFILSAKHLQRDTEIALSNQKVQFVKTLLYIIRRFRRVPCWKASMLNKCLPLKNNGEIYGPHKVP
ncbi:hypothetical protein XENTR_v10007883 [Xenopus tropicalis]|nr:hypothetical protein XENTR_v10007883 [Xenopus tropicalis]